MSVRYTCLVSDLLLNLAFYDVNEWKFSFSKFRPTPDTQPAAVSFKCSQKIVYDVDDDEWKDEYICRGNVICAKINLR